MAKKFKVKVNADLFTEITAKNKTEANNSVLKMIEDMKKYADMDVNSMEIIEAKNK